MNNPGTIFGRTTVAATPKKIMTTSNPKSRKKRSDAKHDIKIRLSPDDKKTLKLHAMDHELSLTAFASLVVKKDLLLDRDYSSYLYDHSGSYIHIVLEKDFFEMIKTLSLNWDMPYRRVVHRIIKEYLWRSAGGIKITTYNEREGRY